MILRVKFWLFHSLLNNLDKDIGYNPYLLMKCDEAMISWKQSIGVWKLEKRGKFIK